jgi:hypothetical protein
MIIAALLMKERSRRRKATRKPCGRCRVRNQLRLADAGPAKNGAKTHANSAVTVAYGETRDSSINDKYAFHDRDKNFCSRCIQFNFDHALLALSFYRDGCDWTSGKIAMRSPRTEPSQSSLAT